MRGRSAAVAVAGALVAPVALVGGLIVVTTMGEHACTKVGCGSQATFDVGTLDPEIRNRAATARLCLDDRCETTVAVDGSIDGVWGRLEGSAVARGSLEVEDAGGAVIARYELSGPVDVDPWYPNGEDCEPACPQLPLVVDGGALRKVTR